MPGYHNSYKRWPIQVLDSAGQEPAVLCACPSWAASDCSCVHPLHAWSVRTGQQQRMQASAANAALTAPVRSFAQASAKPTDNSIAFVAEGQRGVFR